MPCYTPYGVQIEGELMAKQRTRKTKYYPLLYSHQKQNKKHFETN